MDGADRTERDPMTSIAYPTTPDNVGFHRRPSVDAATNSASSPAATLMMPRSAVGALIVAAFLARLWLASWMGLGIDESYAAATSRHLHLSYYDHPPIAWWLAWVAERAAGPGSDFWIRFPFVALFAVSSWLMFRLSSALYGKRAALWAVVLFHVIPVLGITTGTWVLPDGPLVAALLGERSAWSTLFGAPPRRGDGGRAPEHVLASHSVRNTSPARLRSASGSI